MSDAGAEAANTDAIGATTGAVGAREAMPVVVGGGAGTGAGAARGTLPVVVGVGAGTGVRTEGVTVADGRNSASALADAAASASASRAAGPVARTDGTPNSENGFMLAIVVPAIVVPVLNRA